MPSNLNRRTRRAFPLLVCTVVVLAVIVGAAASPPPDVPTYALDSAVIYKCEIALALFLAVYLLVAAIFLAIEGRTVGKISTMGFELPSDLSASAAKQQRLIDSHELTQLDLAERDKRLSGEIDSLWGKLERLDRDRRSEDR